jgi:hypothetical protein
MNPGKLHARNLGRSHFRVIALAVFAMFVISKMKREG